MTGRHRGPKWKRRMLRCVFIVECGLVSHAFSARCMYSKFGHHPHLLGYLYAKFHFFCDLHSWASPWIKIACSINHSLSHSPSLFDALGTETFASNYTLFTDCDCLCAVLFKSLVQACEHLCTNTPLHPQIMLSSICCWLWSVMVMQSCTSNRAI